MEWNVVWFVGSLAGGLLASAIGVEWVRGSRPKSEFDQQFEQQQEERMRRLEQLAQVSRPYVPSCDFQRMKELERRAFDAQESVRHRSARGARIRVSFVPRPPAAIGRNA